MADDLVKTTGTKTLDQVREVDVEIITAAKPESGWLLEARAAINSSHTLQGLFTQADAEGRSDDWLVDSLAIRLNMRWDGEHIEAAAEAAQYLVDEYHQLGQGIHLVGTTTGKVALTLHEDDIYQPAMVPREHGGMAVPLPRIRPDLEAAIVTWTFNKDREKRITDELARRGHQTAYLKEVGDSRLLVATREGRSEIVRQLTQHSPQALLNLLGGTSAAFLQHFDLRTADPGPEDTEGLLGPLEATVRSSSTMNVVDPTTTNLHHSRQQTLRGSLPQGWVRDVARRLTERVKNESGVTGSLPVAELRKWHFQECEFWVGPPELFATVKRLAPKVTYLPSERARLTGFKASNVGIIVVPESFMAESNELFERWETAAHLEYKLWFRPQAFKSLPIADIVYQGMVERRR